MASHVFITAKYLDRCVETGLFGATAQQVNYLAAASPGDTAFLLETATGRIVGPFCINAPLFFSKTPVWESPAKFTYRLRLTSSELWQGDVSALWNVLLRRRVSEFFGFTTFQRSSVGLIGDEGEALAEALREIATHTLSLGNLSVNEEPIDLLQKDSNRFTSEARLEATLLLAKRELLALLEKEGHLPRDASPSVLNQVTLPGLNYNVDILLLCKKHALIIELKRGEFDANAGLQLQRYGRYWDACGLAVTLVGIGHTITHSDSCIAAYSYSIDHSRKSLCLERADKKWHLPT